jgi:two-component sensor histidine kinase
VVLEGRVASGELVLSWREAGGPPTRPPTDCGFGTTLLERVVADRRKAWVGFDWRREGLACIHILPLAEVADRD